MLLTKNSKLQYAKLRNVNCDSMLPGNAPCDIGVAVCEIEKCEL